MVSQKTNSSLHIDKEALSALSLLKADLLSPVTKLMNSKESAEVLHSAEFKGSSFPFPFILSPSGKKNEQVLSSAKSGDVLDFICCGESVGEITVDEVFLIDPKERVRQIYGTDHESHPGVKQTLCRVGRYAVCGDFKIEYDTAKQAKLEIKKAQEAIGAKRTTAIMIAANPLHRAHEKLIRQTLDSTDLVVLFLLKPYAESDLSYQIRHRVLSYFVQNFLPQNCVTIVELEHSYIFAGYNEVILDAIVAKNFGCDRLVIGQHHAGVGMYYSQNSNQYIIDKIKGIDIEIKISQDFVYCNECTTLVSTQTCPHGQHHHISYRSDSILKLLKAGLIPPTVLIRKEFSAMMLCELFPERIENIEKLYSDIMPSAGLIEEHTEYDFYIKLIELHQTTSLT